MRHPQVSWLAGITGELSYELTFLARTLRELTTFIDQLCDECGSVFEKKKLGTELCHNYFGPKFISTTPISIPLVKLEESTERVELDHIDSTLMYYLCFQGEVPLAGMAKKLGLPLSTLTYRKARLQELGVLLADVHFIDRDRFVPASFNLMLSVAHGDRVFREDLMNFCSTEPNFFCCHRCVGDWDYKIGIQAEELSRSSAALEKLKDRYGKSIASLEVVTVTRHYKNAFFPFYRELQQVMRIPSLEQKARASGM
jgi:DNA-binding Lrp family transcriptional regulator